MNLPNWINEGSAEAIAYRQGWEAAVEQIDKYRSYSEVIVDDMVSATKDVNDLILDYMKREGYIK